MLRRKELYSEYTAIAVFSNFFSESLRNIPGITYIFDILQRKELYTTNTAIIALTRNLRKL